MFNAEIFFLFVSVANSKGRSVAVDSADHKPIQKVPNLMNKSGMKAIFSTMGWSRLELIYG